MGKYSIEETCSIAKDMKYEALYWALGFIEYEKGTFEKEYTGLKIVIDSESVSLFCIDTTPFIIVIRHV